jgi:dUTPase
MSSNKYKTEIKKYQQEINKHLENVRNASYRIFYRYDGKGHPPRKNNALEAGFGIFLEDNHIVNVGKVHEIDTKILLRLPKGVIARVVPSLSLIERGIHLASPIIASDHDYEIKLYLTNLTNNYMPHKNQVMLYKNTKVAEIVVEPHSCEYFLERMKLDE